MTDEKCKVATQSDLSMQSIFNLEDECLHLRKAKSNLMEQTMLCEVLTDVR